ncbi:hypothetical protein OHV05_01470 [Kitasatospora sp. NBC_00070]|uniref:hypothetical protein n=1 Tax=Kitasatospora sp. NBC_00070 TaxID=2975962 RepID=UPI003255F3A1
MRDTQAFKDAVAATLAELARLGITVRPGTVADTIERNISTVAGRLGIPEHSAWRYFDAAALAGAIARRRQAALHHADPRDVGRAPLPPLNNPELALLLAGFPDQLAENGGDLYAALLNVLVNAWLAGHIHGEDGCTGCDGSRGPSGHDWQARMDAITTLAPDITRWFDRDVWTAALQDTGFGVTRD